MKTLNNTDANGAAKNVADLERWGDHDTWKLIAKASSKNEDWMKSTKAMQIDGIGVVVQVTTQQGNNIAEALTFVPFATIVDMYDETGTLTGRRIAMQSVEEIPYE